MQNTPTHAPVRSGHPNPHTSAVWPSQPTHQCGLAPGRTCATDGDRTPGAADRAGFPRECFEWGHPQLPKAHTVQSIRTEYRKRAPNAVHVQREGSKGPLLRAPWLSGRRTPRIKSNGPVPAEPSPTSHHRLIRLLGITPPGLCSATAGQAEDRSCMLPPGSEMWCKLLTGPARSGSPMWFKTALLSRQELTGG